MLVTIAILAAQAPALQPLSRADRAAIMAAVGDRLRDGESSRWRWPAYRGGAVYCGWVNSRNALGAYVGFTQYQVIGNHGADGVFDVTRITMPETPADEYVIRGMCNQYGYDVTGPPPEAEH